MTKKLDNKDKLSAAMEVEDTNKTTPSKKSSKDEEKKNSKRKVVDESEEEEEEKVEKKKKKKQKEENKSESVSKKKKSASDEDEGADESSEEEQKKKKNKKSKKEKADSAEESDGEEKSEKKPKKKDEKPAKTTQGSTHRKNFYKESPKLAKATEEEIQTYWNEKNISISSDSSELFKPVRTFDELGFSVDPNGAYSKLWKDATSKFQKPSPIQAQTWPVVLSGRDVVGIAETGSGKTLAFLLPAIVHILDKVANQGKSKNPTVLIVSPTRELAMQISEVAQQNTQVSSVCLYGGVPKDSQKQELRKGVNIIVATPGRLLDLANEGHCNLSEVSFLVLDEADRMLDMGFEKDVRAIVSQVKKQRQTLMFSATWPTTIQQLASEFLDEPVRVTIGTADLQANNRVTQIVEVIEDRARDQRLLELLNKYHKSRKNRILIFVLYKKEAPRLEELLRRRGWSSVSIHSDKSQAQRTQAFESFRSGQEPLLIATDVAARGLDIPDVEYVINYSFPLTIEDYIHRIGRTGRGGKTGTAHTFFTNFDKAHAGELGNVLRDANQEVPSDLMKFGTHVKKKEHKLYGSHFKESSGPVKEKAHIKFDDE